jgi:hypothetical protein
MIRLIGKQVVIPTSSKEAHWGTDTLTEGTLDYLYLFPLRKRWEKNLASLFVVYFNGMYVMPNH